MGSTFSSSFMWEIYLYFFLTIFEDSASFAMESLLPVACEGPFSIELSAFSKTSLCLLQKISFQFFISTGTYLGKHLFLLPSRNPTGIPRSPVTCQNLMVKARKEKMRKEWKKDENRKWMKKSQEKDKKNINHIALAYFIWHAYINSHIPIYHITIQIPAAALHKD